MNGNKHVARGEPLAVSVIDGRLVVSIGVATLANALEWSPDLEAYDKATDSYERPTVTDPEQLAKDIASALCQEEEDGTTPVHRLLDKAAATALEWGCEAVVLPADKA